jgi:proteasome lid subunit RPN8/RPN11
MAVTELPADPDLDAARIETSELEVRNAPVPAGSRGRTFQAVFRRMALEEIHQHGNADTDVEICGVLVGNVYRDANGPWLYVESIIRGDAAEGHATQVTFKAATWEHIQREMEEKHAGQRIVGWYHTHPDFGIFLSGMDLFIQDNFFNLPWQVAFVYDPIGGDEGSFVWRGGKSEREPFLVDEAVTIAESWDLAKRRNRMASVNSANAAAPSMLQRFNAWLETLEPSKAWTVAAVVFLIAFVLAGLGFALFNGVR